MAKRSNTRRSHRKGTRKATRRMRGGFIQMNPADVNDTSMDGPNKLNLMQGQGYAEVHKGQHGGQSMLANGLQQLMKAPAQSGGQAPVGDTGVLDPALASYARIGPLNASFAEIQGMKDQGGGRRRVRKNTKSRGRKSRGRKSRGRKSRGRKMRGGFAPVDEPTMMLPTDMEHNAVQGMNPEWKLAENPASFVPSK